MNLRERVSNLFSQALWFPFSCYLVVYPVGFSLLGLVRHSIVSQPNLSWTRTRSILQKSDSCQSSIIIIILDSPDESQISDRFY